MHLIETMAYAGEKPWHGLGNKLEAKHSIEVWKVNAGMDWQIEESEVRYISGKNNVGVINAFPEQKVLYRSDTKAPLSIVSHRYKVVQPAEILEFYRDLTEIGGYELETAGVLKGGRKLWALARTNQSVTLKGGDTVHGYLLLATACDGTLATTAQFTSVRVVCNNTLSIALGSSVAAIKVPHRSEFDALAVKQELGIAIAPWSSFEDRIRAMADCRVGEKAVEVFLEKVFTYASPSAGQKPTVNTNALKQVQALYAGQGKGAELSSAKGTAWGLLNSVTEYVDHHRRSRSQDHRRDAAWFGQGAQIKHRAWEEALRIVA